jgi:hypothetical protein
LLQYAVVIDEILQIGGIQLGKQRIEKTAAFLTGAGDDLDIVRCDDDTRKAADVPGEFLIGDAVRKELFLAIATEDADHRGLFALVVEFAFDAEARGAFEDIGLVAAGEIALGETQVIEGVQQVSLADAVIATDTHDPLMKAEPGLFIIFELNECYFFYPKQGSQIRV